MPAFGAVERFQVGHKRFLAISSFLLAMWLFTTSE